MYSEFGILKSKGLYGKRSFTFEGAKYWGDGVTKKTEGLFIDNKLELKGKKYYDNGRLNYKGEMKSGKYSGYGSLFHYNGEKKYIGYFKKGDYYGEGQVYDFTGQVMSRADWKNGEIKKFILHKDQFLRGYEILGSLSQDIYIGEVNDKDEKHGFGQKFDKKTGKKQFEGHFLRGEATGFGKKYFRNC